MRSLPIGGETRRRCRPPSGLTTRHQKPAADHSPMQPGENAVRRETWCGRVWSAKPVIVVRDSPEFVALYLPPGTRCARPLRVDGGEVRFPTGDWELVE